MRKRIAFCGILTTIFIISTAITIISCSQDDDCYNSDMYTLAEQMETRNGGDPNNGGELEDNLTYMPPVEMIPYHFSDTVISFPTQIVYMTNLKFKSLSCAASIVGPFPVRIESDIFNPKFKGDSVIFDIGLQCKSAYHESDGYANKENVCLKRNLFQ